MHFKRKRHKSARAGCLLCKPYKRHGWCPRHRNMTFGNFRRAFDQADQMRCEGIKVPSRFDRTD